MSLKNEDLISAVFKKKCLWNKKNKYYHNRHILDRCWNEIARELKQDPPYLKKKWKQLRDTFRTEMKKIPPERSVNLDEDEANYIYPQWPHFKSMMFLKDQIKCRQSSGYLAQQQPIEYTNCNDAQDDCNNIDLDFLKMSPNEERTCMSSFEEETPALHNPSRNLKRRYGYMENDIINIENNKFEVLEGKPRNRIPNDDEDMAFFLSLLPHVKRMSPQTKLLCRMEIQSTVYNHAYEKSVFHRKFTDPE